MTHTHRAVRSTSAVRGLLALVAMMAGVLATRTVGAQSVLMETTGGSQLPSVTPAFSLRAFGFGESRPLRVTVQISRSTDFSAALVLDSTYFTLDTISAIQITRLLPSEAQVYWKARVSTPDGRSAESPLGDRDWCRPG